jgi:MFS transporter, SP family, sugar:H+ symporter
VQSPIAATSLARMGPFTRITSQFNAALARSFFLIFLSTVNYGFDNQGFNTTQAMKPFKKSFGVWNSKAQTYALETYWLSMFNSLNYVGFAVGVSLGSFVSQRWGRRMCMFVMSCWSLSTSAIVLTATNRDHILAGRVLACKEKIFQPRSDKRTNCCL